MRCSVNGSGCCTFCRKSSVAIRRPRENFGKCDRSAILPRPAGAGSAARLDLEMRVRVGTCRLATPWRQCGCPAAIDVEIRSRSSRRGRPRPRLPAKGDIGSSVSCSRCWTSSPVASQAASSATALSEEATEKATVLRAPMIEFVLPQQRDQSVGHIIAGDELDIGTQTMRFHSALL